MEVGLEGRSLVPDPCSLSAQAQHSEARGEGWKAPLGQPSPKGSVGHSTLA